MLARYIVGRVIAVPLRHKLIAAAITVAFIAGWLLWAPRTSPREYKSSALLFFDGKVAAKLDPSGGQTDRQHATDWAESILSDDAVNALCKRFDLFPGSGGERVARFRSNLVLSRESTSSLRVTWRGADRSQTMAVTNALAILLTSWVPDDIIPQPLNQAQALPALPIAPVAPVEKSPQIVQAQARLSRIKSQHETILNDQKELGLALATVDQRLATLGDEVRKLDASIKKANEERQANIAARQPLIAQLAAEKKKLDSLHVRYTDAYPDVEAVQERIAEMEDKLAMAAMRPAPDAEHTRLSEATKEINNLEADRSRLSAHLLEKTELETTIRNQEAQSSFRATTILKRVAVDPRSPQAKPMLSAHLPPPARSAAGSQAVDSIDEEEVRLFRILERAADAQSTNAQHQLQWPLAVAGPLCGILYLLFAVWWFRAVSSVETLRRIVPGDVAYLGAIPGMSIWRHNV